MESPPHPRMTKPLAILLPAALLFLALAGSLNRHLLRLRADTHLTQAAPTQNMPPLVAFTTVALGGNVWTGDLTLPGTEAGQKYRLVIREYEVFQADPQQAPAAVTALTTTHGRRLVYAAVVEL